MAIKIPSKNIYEMENPKIRDNVIDNVSVEQTVVAPNNEYESPVYSEDISKGNSSIPNSRYESNDGDKQMEGAESQSNGIITGWNFAFAYLDNALGYYETTLQIPRVKNNKYISKLYRGTKEEDGKTIDEDVVFFQVSGEITTQPLTGTVVIGDKLADSYISNINYGDETTKEGIIDISNLPTVVSVTNQWATTDITATVTGLNGESSYTIQPYSDSDDYITINVSILCYELIAKLTGTDTRTDTKPAGKSFSLVGEKTTKTPKKLSITVYGNTIGIDLTDGSITYIKDSSGNVVKGVGNKPHSLSRNELLQDSATTNSNLTTKELAENVLTQYEKGKETATLLCDINEYYDYDNNALKISVKNNGLPMTFKIGDEVIPMVSNYTYGNKDDKPMSKYKDGKPKVFIICGIEKIYDGAVWQKLYMQEK